MPKRMVFLSIPGLRTKDVSAMPNLGKLSAGGEIADLVPSFPCVTCPVQANMTTGKLPNQHGVVANGLYCRKKHRVEMWTSPNDCIESPQIWDAIRQGRSSPQAASWFLLHSKGSKADYVCTPAPIHNPDGTESLWCYTRPRDMYGELRNKFGHFPLKNFWGPMASSDSSVWIADSALWAAKEYRPDFFMIYLPHLDYAAQKSGPDSEAAARAVAELDVVIGKLADGIKGVFGDDIVWIVAGEYAISSVDHVAYPNRMLREAGLLKVRIEEDGEHLDLVDSQAWAMVDHQFSHVFVKGADKQVISKIVDIFQNEKGIANVLAGEKITDYGLGHSRSGEVVLISTPDSWQAYYWWFCDETAPRFAWNVDIHNKPGYDPIELFFDLNIGAIPLNADLIRGSHGAPALGDSHPSTIVVSVPGLLSGPVLSDTDVFDVVLRHFGIGSAE